MTIYNQTTNVSDDYTYIIDAQDIFFDINDVDFAYYYDDWEREWTELSLTANMYQNIQDAISNDAEITPIFLNHDDDFLSLDPTQQLYHGIITEQTGFPNIPENTYIALIKIPTSQLYPTAIAVSAGTVIDNDSIDNHHDYVCIPIKSSLLSSQTQIWTIDEYTPNDKEYLSAKFIYNKLTNISNPTSSLEIITLTVNTSDLIDEGLGTAGDELWQHFELLNPQPANIANRNAIYKILLNYDEELGPLGAYYLSNVVTRYYMYVDDGSGHQFVSLGVDENDIAEMISEQIGNIEEDMLS